MIDSIDNKIKLIHEWVDYFLESGRKTPSANLLAEICKTAKLEPEELYYIIEKYSKEKGFTVTLIGGENE